MKILLPVPEKSVLFYEGNYWLFYYYILNNEIGLFLKFLHPGSKPLKEMGIYAPFLLFKDKEEFDRFTQSAKESIEKIQNIPQNTFSSGCNRLDIKKKMDLNATFTIRLEIFYQEWIKENRDNNIF